MCFPVFPISVFNAAYCASKLGPDGLRKMGQEMYLACPIVPERLPALRMWAIFAMCAIWIFTRTCSSATLALRPSLLVLRDFSWCCQRTPANTCRAQQSHRMISCSSRCSSSAWSWWSGLSGTEIEFCALGGLDERLVEVRARLEYRLVCTQRQAGGVEASEVFM
jgi:hypothetical protein